MYLATVPTPGKILLFVSKTHSELVDRLLLFYPYKLSIKTFFFLSFLEAMGYPNHPWNHLTRTTPEAAGTPVDPTLRSIEEGIRKGSYCEIRSLLV